MPQLPEGLRPWGETYRRWDRASRQNAARARGQFTYECSVIEVMLGMLGAQIDLASVHGDTALTGVCASHHTKVWHSLHSAYLLAKCAEYSEAANMLRVAAETAFQNRFLHNHTERLREFEEGARFQAAAVRKELPESDIRWGLYEKLCEVSHPRRKAFESFLYSEDGGATLSAHLPGLYEEGRVRQWLGYVAFWGSWPIAEFNDIHEVPEQWHHNWALLKEAHEPIIAMLLKQHGQEDPRGAVSGPG